MSTVYYPPDPARTERLWALATEWSRVDALGFLALELGRQRRAVRPQWMLIESESLAALSVGYVLAQTFELALEGDGDAPALLWAHPRRLPAPQTCQPGVPIVVGLYNSGKSAAPVRVTLLCEGPPTHT